MYIHSRYHYSPIVNKVDIYLLIQKDVLNILSEKASYKQICINDTMGNIHTYKHTCTHTHNTSLEGRIMLFLFSNSCSYIFKFSKQWAYIQLSQPETSKQTNLRGSPNREVLSGSAELGCKVAIKSVICRLRGLGGRKKQDLGLSLDSYLFVWSALGQIIEHLCFLQFLKSLLSNRNISYNYIYHSNRNIQQSIVYSLKLFFKQ